jgi:hypothetical protein
MNTGILQVEPDPAAPHSEMIPKKPAITPREIAILYAALSCGVFLLLLLLTLFIWYVATQAGQAWDFGKLLMFFDLPIFICYIGASCWYLFTMLWKRGQLHAEELEHHALARQRAIEAEVLIKERERMLLRGDHIGNYPAYVPPTEERIIRLAPGNSPAKPSKVDERPITQEEEVPRDVQVKGYEYYLHQIPLGHALLGIDLSTGEVVTCAFGQLLTTWIVGGSGRGKTNTVAMKVYEAIQLGYKLVVIDPHANKDDSLANKLKPFADAILGEIAWEDEHIEAVLDWFWKTFQERRYGQGTKEKLLLIVDEVGNLSRNEQLADKLKKIARMCGQEGRGFHMAGYFISQQAAGLKWLRDSAITVLVHKLVMLEERKLALNNNMELVHCMEQFGVGRIVVYGQEIEPRVLQMPLFASERMRQFLQPGTIGPHTRSSRQEPADDEVLARRVSTGSMLRGASTQQLLPLQRSVPAEKELERDELPTTGEGKIGKLGKSREVYGEDAGNAFQVITPGALEQQRLVFRTVGKAIGKEGQRILDVEPRILRMARKQYVRCVPHGEEKVATLKRLCVTSGRAYQEIGWALDMFAEERQRGKLLLTTRREVEASAVLEDKEERV